LIELGTEELPVKACRNWPRPLLEGIVGGLDKRGVARQGSARSYYTRAVWLCGCESVASEQPEQRSEVLGPYLNIGLDAAGEPTPA
jgi:glycyl-tRNA synthetase beta chain